LTHRWWEKARSGFELYISEIVLLEISDGDRQAAESRLNLAKELRLLDLTPKCNLLAQRLLRKGGLPSKAATDASHIATAAVHHMDYLLTWNCRHIANAVLIPILGSIMATEGYVSPVICTPPQLVNQVNL
jgi:predicted nucleic acid-binding protein